MSVKLHCCGQQNGDLNEKDIFEGDFSFSLRGDAYAAGTCAYSRRRQ